jgi:chloramphenicol 3-O-phosphotransferase
MNEQMKVIVLNGPMGVGKTSVGKYIADTNEGAAFIDGDWCLDLHPFIGNHETKTMAIDNILHIINNYRKCSLCKMIVLVWLMDDEWVRQSIVDGISAMDLDVQYVTLMCDRDELVRRWKNDDKCEWRTDEWLAVSLKSLSQFAYQKGVIDTTGLSIHEIAETIIG